MKGVSRYASSKFVGKLDSDIIPKAVRKGMKIYGVCCSYDTDVFEDDESPVVDWLKLKKSIMRLDIEEFCKVEVKSAIEDWLLDDLEGLCAFLKQKEVPKSLKGSNGYAKLLNLFKLSGKVYAKGTSVEDFIDCLNIEKIRNKRKAALSELERILNATVDTEVKSILGRADVVIKTQTDVFVLELKVDDTVETALAQIEDKGYVIPYEADGRRVTKCGVTISSEARNINHWRFIDLAGNIIDEQKFIP